MGGPLAVGVMSAAAPWLRSQMKAWAQVASQPLCRYCALLHFAACESGASFGAALVKFKDALMFSADAVSMTSMQTLWQVVHTMLECQRLHVPAAGKRS